MAHQVQPTCNGVTELVVAVQRVALGLVRTPGVTAIKGVTQVGLFADHVDRAARCATTAEGRVRALGDFNGFNRENFAALRARITYAIEVGVALGVKATDERTVALWVAAFACTERHAGHSAQRILQGGRCGIFYQLLRDDGDRAWGIDQGGGVLGRVGFFDLVRLFSLLARNRGRAKGKGIALRLAVSAFSGLSHVRSRGRSNRYTNGRSQ